MHNALFCAAVVAKPGMHTVFVRVEPSCKAGVVPRRQPTGVAHCGHDPNVQTGGDGRKGTRRVQGKSASEASFTVAAGALSIRADVITI